MKIYNLSELIQAHNKYNNQKNMFGDAEVRDPGQWKFVVDPRLDVDKEENTQYHFLIPPDNVTVIEPIDGILASNDLFAIFHSLAASHPVDCIDGNVVWARITVVEGKKEPQTASPNDVIANVLEQIKQWIKRDSHGEIVVIEAGYDAATKAFRSGLRIYFSQILGEWTSRIINKFHGGDSRVRDQVPQTYYQKLQSDTQIFTPVNKPGKINSGTGITF